VLNSASRQEDLCCPLAQRR